MALVSESSFIILTPYGSGHTIGRSPIGNLEKGLDDAGKYGWVLVDYEARLEKNLSVRKLRVQKIQHRFTTTIMPLNSQILIKTNNPKVFYIKI